MRFAASVVTVFITIGSGAAAMAADIPGLGVQTAWKKFCYENRQAGSPRICDTRAEVRMRDDNSTLAAVELIEQDGDARKILRVTFPLGTQLKYGTRLIFDGVGPQQSLYTACAAAGCMSDYEATPVLLASMKAALGLAVQAIDRSGQPLTVTLSLNGFSTVYDGPGIESAADEMMEPPKPWLDDTLDRKLRPRAD